MINVSVGPFIISSFQATMSSTSFSLRAFPLVAVAVLTACAARSRASETAAQAPPQIMPFTISSLNDTLFAFVGDFRGGFTVTEDSVLIYLAPAMIRNQPRRKGYDRPRVLGSVNPGLAAVSGPGGRWKIVTERNPIRIGKTVGIDETFDLPVARFSLPRPKDRDLSEHWLVFEIAEETTYAAKPDHKVAFSYAHSTRRLFQAFGRQR